MAPHRIASLALALASLALVTPPSARAQTAAESTAVPHVDEDARLHFELGRRAFARADYESAASEFEEATRLSQRPELHYNLFLVYHELDRDEDALRELRLYIPSESDPEVREHLEQRAARIEHALADRAAPAEEAGPPPETIDLGETVVVPVADPPSPPPASSDADVLVGLGVAGLGAAAIAIAVTVGAGVAALDQRHALDASCAPSCSGDEVASTRSLALASDVSLGVGGALAIAGAILLAVGLTSSSSSEPGPTPVVTPVVTPTSAGLVVTGVL